MKILIAIVVLLVLLQAGTFGVGLMTGAGEAPTRQEIEDGEWDPTQKVAFADALDALTEAFRPRLALDWEDDQLTLSPGSEETVPFGNGHEERRLARFGLVGGDGVRIVYRCTLGGPGHRCPQERCLCPPGRAIDPQRFARCDGFDPRANRCPSDGDTSEIIVYSRTGTLVFSAIGETQSVVAQQ